MDDWGEADERIRMQRGINLISVQKEEEMTVPGERLWLDRREERARCTHQTRARCETRRKSDGSIFVSHEKDRSRS